MKASVTQERIRKVLAGVLTPLARTLLRCGVSYSEFADLSKRAFVEAASQDYGVRNRPTNIARVAVMTGLSRKEVSRIRSEGRKKSRQQVTSITLPAAVLKEWHSGSRYLDRSGMPRVLPFSGGHVSFTSLVTKISRDIPPGAMLRELVRAGAVRVIGKDLLLPVKRHFVPDSADEKIVVGLELGLRRLAETIAFNSDPEKRGAIRFQRFVESPPLSSRETEQARVKLHDALPKFSIAIDDLMSSCRTTSRGKLVKRIEKCGRVGVGIYYYEAKP